MKHDTLVSHAAFLVSGSPGDNPEYERGMAELIMMQCCLTGDDVEGIIADIHTTAYKTHTKGTDQ